MLPYSDMEYKQVLGYEGIYKASAGGDIISLTREVGYRFRGMKRVLKGRTLKPKTNIHGYLAVTLCKDGTVKDRTVHSVIAEAFFGDRPAGLHVAHLDGNKTNNKKDNLAFCTPKENEAHKIAHGTVATGKRNGKYTKPHKTPKGVNHGQSKFTQDEVDTIRTSDVSCIKLAKQYSVSKTSILNIKNNKTYVL